MVRSRRESSRPLHSRDMKRKGTGHVLYNLPKKKLQELCKKYGLSPYKAKPFLANSLISFFKSAGVETFEGTDLSWENNQGSSYVCNKRGKASASTFIPGPTSNAFKDTVRITQTGSSKSKSVSGIKSSHAPFEFSVMSEEGINIVVDLNSSLSDWYKRMESEMCICKSVQKQEFQSFRQELQNLGNKQMTNSFPVDQESDSRNCSLTHPISSPILCSVENVVSGNPDKGDGSLELSATKSGYHSENYSAYVGEKEELPPSSRCCSSLQNQIVSNTYLREETGSTDPNASYAFEGIVENKAICMACGPEKILEDQNTNCHNVLLGQQTGSVVADVTAVKAEARLNLNVNLVNEKCTDMDTQSTCSLDKPLMLQDVPSANDTTDTRFSDAKFQEKRASCSSEYYDCSMDLTDAADSIKPTEFSDSCEDDHSSLVDNKPKSGAGNDIISCCRHPNDIHLNGKEFSNNLLKTPEFTSDGKQRKKA